MDQALSLWGVPDRDDDPAVVAIELSDHATCGGALIAPDIVVTAGRCLTAAMPPVHCLTEVPVARVPSPLSIRVFVSDLGPSPYEGASAGEVLVAHSDADCHGDIGFVLLDTPFDDIAPLPIRTTGAAKGDRLRTVGYDRHGTDSTLRKFVRDHLPVIDVTPTRLQIGEPCWRTEGGPAVDEATGEVVGIALNAGDGRCDGATPSEIYARTDVLLTVMGEVLSKSNVGLGLTRGKKKTKKGPIDMGATCAQGADCAAGVCVEEPMQEYCSRTCSPHDHCPTHFRCQQSAGGSWVCVEH